MKVITSRRLIPMTLLGMLAALVAVLGLAAPASASHYRATQITWEQVSGTTVEFTATASWRCSFYFSSCPSPGATFSPVSLNFGDGSSSDFTWTVTSVDPANDVLNAEKHATHTYAGTGPFVTSLSDCCRLSGPQHVNNPDRNIRTETLVDLAQSSASPVSSVAPIVDCGLNSVCQFVVPGFDPDGQDLRWRFATSTEAGGFFVQPGPPYATNAATIDPATGLYRWDTTGATLSSSGSTYYSTQVMIENLVGSTVVSRTAVDFFIRLSSNTSNQAPVFEAPTPADGTTYDVSVGDTVTFDVQAMDPDGADTVTLSMLNKPATATFSPTAGNPATGTFSWTPTAVGTTILNLQAQDQNGLGATARSVTITVTDANEAPAAGAGGPYSGDEGSAIAISGTATDDDGDTVTTVWSVAGDAGNDVGADCVIADPASLATTVTCDDDGTWTLTLSADDGNGGSDSSTASLTVGNLDPSVAITTPVDGALYPVGSTVDLSANVDDPGANDAVSCSTDWDDGATSTSWEAAGACTDSHSYAAAGVYTINLTGTDGDGGSASDSVMVVVYDPSAGFATGGGWIESPAGAYVADPSLSGRANFGFVAKYKRGATVPDGQTEFQFHAGDLNFHSTSYDWLVVAGHKAQFKGTGTINGVGDHRFMITAYDGGHSDPDRFRIRIWNDSGLVYDNKIGTSNDIDAADPQVIGGGSIKIHQ